MLVQKWSQEFGVMVARIVQHDDHAPAARSLIKQLLEEMPEGFGIEHLAHLAYKLARAQVDEAWAVLKVGERSG